MSSSGEWCQVLEGILGALEVVAPEMKTCLLVKRQNRGPRINVAKINNKSRWSGRSDLIDKKFSEMNKFKVLAWAGVLFNTLALVATVPEILTSPLTEVVGLVLQLAGIVLCIGLIQKKSSALPKARLLLLVSAGWSVLGSIVQYLTNPEDLSIPGVNPSSVAAFALGIVILKVAVNLVLWKAWGSEEAAKYANA